jgi:myosin heavy subunit
LKVYDILLGEPFNPIRESKIGEGMAAEVQRASSSMEAIPNGVLQPSAPDPLQDMKKLMDVVKALSQDKTYKGAYAVFDEHSRLRKEIQTRDEDLRNVKEMVAKKEVAVEEMFEANRKESQKHAEVKQQIDTLEKKIKEREEMITNQKKAVEDLNQKVHKLENTVKENKDKVVQANKDIDVLQERLKGKDVEIDTLKTAGSKMKRAYEALNAKAKGLEVAKEALDQQIQKNSARVKELEGYAIGYGVEDGNTLYASPMSFDLKVRIADTTSRIDEMFSLWSYASEEITKHMEEGLPVENLKVSMARTIT